jgi:hypothetical protein
VFIKNKNNKIDKIQLLKLLNTFHIQIGNKKYPKRKQLKSLLAPSEIKEKENLPRGKTWNKLNIKKYTYTTFPSRTILTCIDIDNRNI